MQENKGYLQISFAWLFAIIVGAVILFIAIFFSSKLIKTEQEEISLKTGKEFGILLNPLETGFESLKSNSIIMPIESRIYNKCNLDGVFGRQRIQISQKNFGKWTETDLDVGFSNKYLFSENVVEGKKYFLFSKPLNFPFKVTDLIIVTSSEKKYCFQNAPEEIANEISRINQENLYVENCSKRNANVVICFEGESGCNINVDYEDGIVKKGSDTIYFEGDALMYAAIFSDKNIYECQLKRIMKRIKTLSTIYIDKANFVSMIGCNTNLNSDLLVLINLADNLKSSSELNSIKLIADDIDEKNKEAICKLW